MFRNLPRALALAATFSLSLAGFAPTQALAHDAGFGQILSELPADAPAGDCYARVRVPGEPAAPPPVMQGSQWVLNPGPPGSPGPIWCLMPTGPVQVAAPVETIARYGWIRVLCEADATPARIGQVQRRLSERGEYRGEISGRYDSTTADAVARFQSREHISHGGYLSLDTLQALEQAGSSYSYQSTTSYGGGSIYAPGYASAPSYPYPVSPCAAGCQQQVYLPPPPLPPPPPVYQPAPCPCYAPPPPCCAQAAYPGGYQVPYQAQPQVYGYQTYGAYTGGVGYGASYGYGQGYGSGYGYGYVAPPQPAYAAASAHASALAGGAYASARASAGVVQNGWLMWPGKSGY